VANAISSPTIFQVILDHVSVMISDCELKTMLLPIELVGIDRDLILPWRVPAEAIIKERSFASSGEIQQY